MTNDESPVSGRALDPGASFIIQAPAGSGKTELLIQRYLMLLARVERPEEIVAITFTRKAANEMRARVGDALRVARSGEWPAAPHLRRSAELAHAVLERDREKAWDIETNPARMQIQTIDALNVRLTQTLPILSRFGVQPETLDDARDLYREAAHSTVQELEGDSDWSDAIASLLAHIDNDVTRLESLLAQMLERRDQWQRHIGPSRSQLEAAIAHAVGHELATLNALFPVPSATELTLLGRFAGNHVDAALAPSIAQCADLDGPPGATPEALDLWRGVADLLLTQQGEWRRKVNRQQGFPAPGGASGTDKTLFADMKQRHADLVTHLDAVAGFRQRLAAVRKLPPATYTDQQWQVLDALFKVLRLASAQLWVVCGSHAQIDFQGVATAALHALGDLDAPTDLALALDYQIKHILVDEFQDTSVTQFQLLERLSAGWAEGDGHTLFLVGDPMQSIYRFREAEVGLFIRTRALRRLGTVGLEPLTLTDNYRSESGIVEWVNANFAQIFPTNADVDAGAVEFVDSHAVRARDEGGVTVHPILPDGRTEADSIIELLEGLHAERPDDEIAILVRSRNHLIELVQLLKARGMRFKAVEIDTLGERAAVLDLLALTRALLHPADRIAWLTVLRAPWCGLTLSDLCVLAADNGHATVWESVGDRKLCARLTDDGRARLERVRGVLNTALAERRRRSLPRWVEGVWLALGGPAAVENESDLENARSYLELLGREETAGDLVALASLEQRVTELYAAPDLGADTRLQIMTLHKAKGLEFDTVIIPGLGRRSASDDERLLEWMERPESAELLIAPMREVGGERDRTFDFIAGLSRQQSRYEEARLLYVGATRARRSLHLFGDGQIRENAGETSVRPLTGSLLEILWPAVAPVYERALEQLALGEPPAPDYRTAQRSLRRFVAGWPLPAPAPAVDWSTDAGREASDEPGEAIEFAWASPVIRHVGVVVHALLQRIGEDGLAAWDKPRLSAVRSETSAQLSAHGVPKEALETAVAQVETAVSNALQDERGRWLLDADHEASRHEYRLTGSDNGKLVNVRIDRTFIDEAGTRWIVDYKSSAHAGTDLEGFLDREQDRYAAQLERYARLLRAIDQRPIRCGLYFPLLRGWRSWKAEV